MASSGRSTPWCAPGGATKRKSCHQTAAWNRTNDSATEATSGASGSRTPRNGRNARRSTPTFSTPPHTAPHTREASSAAMRTGSGAAAVTPGERRQVGDDDRGQREDAAVGEVDLARDRVGQREARRIQRDHRAVGEPVDQQLDQEVHW